MPRKIIFIIASVFFAVLAVLAANVYLTQQAQAVKQQAQKEVARSQAMRGIVVIAKSDIPKGTALDMNMLDTKLILKEYLEPRAVQYPERVVGMMTLVPISKDEQITFNKLMSAKEISTKTSLAMNTPVGKRAISIPVDNLTSLMGMIRSGDYVDVLATVPVPTQMPDGKQVNQPAVLPLFQNVLVLAVDQEAGAGGGAPEQGRYEKAGPQAKESPKLITLALTPQEANLLAFVQEQGRVRLALRSPADSNIEQIQVANWETLFSYLIPQEMKDKIMAEQQKQSQKGAQPAELQKPPERQIEIYRGMKKDTISVTKNQ